MLRKVLVLTAALFAVLTTAAQAHTASASVSCGSVTVNWLNFASTGGGNGGLNTPSYSITYTPHGETTPTVTFSGQVSFPGSFFSMTFAIPPFDGTVAAASTWTTAQTRDHTADSASGVFTVGDCPKSSPQISTTAQPASATVDTPLTDVADLSGGDRPSGTITWRLYGPSDPSCSNPNPPTVTGSVDGDGDYTSPAITPTVAGTYHWVASYGGDPYNNPVSGSCGDANETVTVGPATPALTTTATPSTVTVGQPVHDVAHLSGGLNPTGSITFNLYGPNPSGCTGTPVQSVTTPINGDGDYSSPSVTPTGVGTYVWVASYSGDTNNIPLSNGCAESTETVTVTPATPALTTTATPSTVTVGQPVHDVAHLSGGDNPTGTITFDLYGPNPSGCTGTPVQSVTTTVSGDGDYSSPSVTPTGTGTYVWVANYGGDANNAPLSNGCAESTETVTVTPTTPALTTTASPSTVAVGQPVHDVAHLSGGDNPTGTITFDLYGPNPSGCTGTPVQSVTTTVSGDGDYSSPSVTPTGVGTYVWVASYGGDANNAPLSNGCAEATETVTVVPAVALTTTASSASITLGASVADVATLSGGNNPTGTLQWALYGPNDATCSSSSPLQTTTVAVTGDGKYTSPPLTPTAAGAYQWVATYSGDANNSAVGPVGCTDPNEAVTVSSPPPPPPPPPSLTPSFTLQKLQAIDNSGQAFTAAPIIADIGQKIDYEVVVTNTGNEALNLALVDTMCTSVAGPTGNVSGTTLAVGGTAIWTCSHVVVAGDFPTYVNVAQVTGTPPGGSPLPPERSSVLANVPKANVLPACVASPITIKQTTTSSKQTVNAIVSGGGLEKVVFSLDGRVVKTLTKPNLSGGRYELSVKVSSTRYGKHAVTAKATNGCGKTSSDGVTFTHNAPVKTVVPRFTG